MARGTRVQVRQPRQKRCHSHAPVELRPWRFWPWGVRSGILLDISPEGLKVELTAPGSFEVGKTYWAAIALAPFKILETSRFHVQFVCRWIDSERVCLGGLFEPLSSHSRDILTRICQSQSVLRRKRA